MTELLPIPVEDRPERVEGEIINGGFFMLEPSPFKRATRRIVDGLPLDAKLDEYARRAEEELPKRFHGHLEIWVGEERIDPQYWSQVRPKHEHLVYVRVMPQGKTVKNVLRAVMLIAVAAAAFALLGPASAFVTTTLGLSGVAASIVGGLLVAGATLLGSMLVNAIIPAPGLTNEPGTRDPRYQLTGSSNRFVPYGKIPRVYGKMRLYPMLAGQPYTEIVGKDQFLRMLLVVGWGPLRITDIKIGETDILSYQGAQVEITEGGPTGWGGNQTIRLYNRDVDETSLQIETLQSIPSIIQTTPLNTVEIGVDLAFPQGLIEWTKKGKKKSRRVTHRVEYRAVGSGTWLTPNWEYDYTGRSKSGGILEATGTTQDAYRISGRWKVSAGQYEVRVTRLTAPGVQGETTQIDTSYWTAFRSFADSQPVLQDGLCLIAVRLKATDQLNGVPQQINCIAEAYVPTTLDGTSWNYTLTRNPAWAYADILRRRGNEQFLPDSRIDVPEIMAWATDCDATAPNASEPRWTFDGVIEGGSVFDGLRQVASIGRAAFNIKDGLYSVVRDKSQATPVQHITPRNSWGYQGTKAFADQPHAFKVEFQNANEGYRMDERFVYADGYDENNATKFEVLQLFGATSPDLVWREARYFLAVGKLRPEEHTVNMDIEALRCTMGSRVEFAHDVIVVGNGYGRITALDINGPNVEGVTLDGPVEFESGKTYQLRVRHKDGSSSIRTVTSPGGALGETADVEFVGEPIASAPEVGDLFMFGETDIVTAPMIVKRIEPTDELAARLTLVPYDEAIYTADTGTIPPFTSYMTDLPNNTPPPLPNLAFRSDDSAIDVMDDGTVLARIAVDLTPGHNGVTGTHAFEVQWREYDSTQPNVGDWTDAGTWPASTTTVWIRGIRVDADIIVRARALGNNNLNSLWVELPATTVTGKGNPPGQPTAPSVVAGYRGNYLGWTDPIDNDLAYVEVWASQTNDFGTASRVGASSTQQFTHANLTADGLPWYYWLVSVDTSGNAATELAAGNATALSIADWEGIGDDGTLSPQEKLSVVREYAVLTGEEAALVSAAANASVSSTNYEAAVDALTSYLTGLSPAWNDTTQSTTIVRATWNSTWNAVYTERTALQAAIDDATPAGADGLNNATVYIYQRSATPPSVPSVSTTYTFATGAIAGLNNGWSQTIPAGSDPLYVTVATASSQTATDTIASGEWASPVILAQDGTSGTDGLNVASVFIYQRGTSAPALPTVNATFTFATGGITGLDNGWSQTIPSGPEPLYVAQATASNTTTTDTIAPGEWSTPRVLALDGYGGGSAGLSMNDVGADLVDSNFIQVETSTIEQTGLCSDHVSSYSLGYLTTDTQNVAWGTRLPIIIGPDDIWECVAVYERIGGNFSVRMGFMAWDETGAVVNDNTQAGITTEGVDGVYFERKRIGGANVSANDVDLNVNAAATMFRPHFRVNVSTANQGRIYGIFFTKVSGYARWADVSGSSRPEDFASTGNALNAGHACNSLERWWNDYDASVPISGNPSGVNYSIQTPADVPAGNSCLQMEDTDTGFDGIKSQKILIDHAKTYRLSCWARQISGDRNQRLAVFWLDENEALITAGTAGLTGWAGNGTHTYWAQGVGGFPSSWTYYEQFFGASGASVPANAKYFVIGTYGGDGGTVNSVVQLAGYKVEDATLTPWSLVPDDGSRPADNATVNNVTYDPSAPSNPVDGDIWVNTTTSPFLVNMRIAGAWQATSNYTTNTNELTDGANLGGTADWTGVSGRLVFDYSGFDGEGDINDPDFEYRAAGDAATGWPPASGQKAISATGGEHGGAKLTITGNGAIQDYLYRQWIPCQPGDLIYVRARYRANGITGSTLDNAFASTQNNSAETSPTFPSASASIISDNTWRDYSGIIVVAAGRTKYKPRLSVRADDTSGTLEIDFVQYKKISAHEVDADVTKIVNGVTSINIAYDSEGTIKSGEVPKTRSYTLQTSTGITITSGISWSVSTVTGSWSGTAPSISGSGTGVLSINSGPAANEAVVQVKATYEGRDYTFTVDVAKVQDPPEIQTATQASKSVGGTFNSSWTDITGELVFSTGLSSTQATLTASNISLTAQAFGTSGNGSANCEMRWVWWNGSSWVVVGTADASNPDPDVLDEGGGLVLPNNNGSVTSNETKTGLTADTEYRFKLQARIESTTGANTITSVTALGNASGSGV